MLSNPISALLLVGVGTAIFFLAIRTLFFGHDPREPPVPPGSIPILGHVLSLAKSKFNFYVQLSQETRLPIFTISLPGQKMYVVTKPELIQAVQKQYRKLAFPPIEAKFATRACGISPATQKILDKNLCGEEGDWGLSMESYEVMRTSLKPGRHLDAMNLPMIEEVSASLDRLQPPMGTSHKFNLRAWIRQVVTMATTKPVFGPMNPYNDQTLVDEFWQYESGLMSILVAPLPGLMARKSVQAREKIVKAFVNYYQTGGLKEASAFAKNRFAAGERNGISVDDNARYDVGGSIALLVNTVPAVFWTVMFLYSRAGLLEEVREELDMIIDETTEDGEIKRSIDITKVKEQCPFFMSMYQEVLRVQGMGTAVREVTTDTYLNQWLLKKGAMVQMPGRVIHQDPQLWGSNVSEFHPRRFLKEEKANRPRDVCFRAFGGGKTLCPGRHFATNEILAIVALFAIRFDMKPSEGEWKFPTVEKTTMIATILEPDTDVEVEISRRKGFEDGKWAISLTESDKVFAMVTEDK